MIGWVLRATLRQRFCCMLSTCHAHSLGARRHRLVVPKYNPARTFTPEGAVGLGGAYMCIYPMESPGGYQLIGRTLPIWNTFGRVGPFSPATPWLLRYFDQVRTWLQCWSCPCGGRLPPRTVVPLQLCNADFGTCGAKPLPGQGKDAVEDHHAGAAQAWVCNRFAGRQDLLKSC